LFAPTHPLAQANEQAQRKDHSDHKDNYDCDCAHGIRPFLYSPTVYEKLIRKGIRHAPNLCIGESAYTPAAGVGSTGSAPHLFLKICSVLMGFNPHV
jgi:hypothetical protein